MTGGIDLATVKEILGHREIEMTLRYSHLAPAHKAKPVERLGEVLDEISKPKEHGAEHQKTEAISQSNLAQIRNVLW